MLWNCSCIPLASSACSRLISRSLSSWSSESCGAPSELPSCSPWFLRPPEPRAGVQGADAISSCSCSLSSSSLTLSESSVLVYLKLLRSASDSSRCCRSRASSSCTCSRLSTSTLVLKVEGEGSEPSVWSCPKVGTLARPPMSLLESSLTLPISIGTFKGLSLALLRMV